MTDLSSGLAAELLKDRFTLFGAVKIEFPETWGTVRLLDGSAEIEVLPGEVFRGEHAVFGSLAGIEGLSDGADGEAPAITLTLDCPAETDPADVADASMQGSRVRIWMGARDDATGLMIGDPYQLSDGEVDVVTPVIGLNSLALEQECVGGMERLFMAEEGIRLAPAVHKRIFPGETGLDGGTGAVEHIYWGQNAPSGVSR